ncbi:hypothetical protein [Planifilum fulgidum]|nr:hypothetical protein [Planifilum fulgidum]
MLIAVTFIPETSLTIAVLGGIYCALLILFVLFSRAKRWHRSRKFRILFGLTHVDVSAILAAILAARIMHGSVGVFLLVLGIFLLGILAGHRYSGWVMDELQRPKTPAGKLLVAFGSLGGLAVLWAQWFGRYASRKAFVVFLCASVFVILAVVHAFLHAFIREAWSAGSSSSYKG